MSDQLRYKISENYAITATIPSYAMLENTENVQTYVTNITRLMRDTSGSRVGTAGERLPGFALQWINQAGNSNNMFLEIILISYQAGTQNTSVA